MAETGAGFAGGAVWGMGQGPHSHDMFARPDLGTYTPLPYEPGVARFASDLYVDGEPHPYCPRVQLKRALADARRRGYVFNVGIEPEFFLVVKNPDGSIRGWDPHGVDDLVKPCYDYQGDFRRDGLPARAERGPRATGLGCLPERSRGRKLSVRGEFPVCRRPDDGRPIHVFPHDGRATRAARSGAIATFMAKPFSTRTGSGAHMHYHLADAGGGATCFSTRPTRAARPFDDCLSFHRRHSRACAGALRSHIADGELLQAASDGAGAHRLALGLHVDPAFITYGDNNRTQMLRIPEGGHIEDRSISSAFNPYLGIAAYLAAGLDGIDRGLDPGEPNLGNLYTADLETMSRRGVRTLPQSLAEALGHFERDQVVRESLGPIADEFLRLKRDEWREYHAQVESWEIGAICRRSEGE